MKFDITHALQSLVPGTRWVHRGTGYDGLDWQDDTPAPTRKEVEAEIARLQAEYDNLEYQRNRKMEYPSVVDQLDTLYHGGYDAWKASVELVKTKYPKP